MASALVVAIAGLVAAGVLTIATGVALRGFGISLGLTAILVVTVLLTQGIAFGGVALLYLRIRGLGLAYVPIRVPSVRDLAWAGAGYVLALVGVGVGVAIVALTGADAAPNQIG